ncbi:Holliday junction branch migration protein RuvA [Mycoplasmopsis cricetuli]|uniref:Holliday junction branch migration protein RuvA n=1 Tax=Mycoplasmopsis cricetuli TaxID=171283 RepID=UPI0004701694|nr:Holliday junction branch migration protein RuvA [Mycoplasmopsis cricetuli]
MLLYKIGEIIHKNGNNLIFESRGDGYIINIANETRFKIHEKIKIYLYEYHTDYLKSTYGFKDFKERLLFVDLIAIDKIGPKIAMSILDKGWEYIAELISQENWTEIAKFPFINEKTARYLCVELSTKWGKMINKKIKDSSEMQGNLKELTDTLNSLGFRKKQIDYAIANLTEKENIDTMIEQSIELIAKKYNENSSASI